MTPRARPRIALVNLPFSAVESPAIGLTQLKSVIERDFPGRFDVGIHAFARAADTIHSVLRYAGRCRFFASTDNILSRDFIAEVIPRLRVPAGVTLQFEVRANLDDAELAALAAAGVTVIQPGIESLSSDTLRRMK